MSKGKGFTAVLLCLPILLIAFFAIKYRSETVSDIVSVSLKVPENPEIKYEKASDVDFFVSLLNDATPVGSAIRDISAEEPIKISYCRTDKRIDYKIYPSLDLSGCMIEGPIGEGKADKFYVISKDDAKKLVLRDELSYLYSSLFLPKFIITSGEKTVEVLPTEVTWNYRKPDEKIYEYTPERLSDGEDIFTVVKGLENSMSFESTAITERCEMTELKFVTESGMEFDIDNISELDLSNDTLVNVSFKAAWSSYGGAQCYGEARYKFGVLYDLPANIELDSFDHKAGDIVVINATHLNSREQADVSCDLLKDKIGFSVTESDNGVALIPIPYSAKPQAYTVDIFTGADTKIKSFNTKIFENTAETLMISVSEEQHDKYLSVAGMAAYEAKIAEITGNLPEENRIIFGKDKFILPLGAKKNPDRTYGQAVMLGVADGSTDLGRKDLLGEIYYASAGTNVKSAQAGVVVFCGETDPTGKSVIIYHGYGIFSHYYHLEDFEVTEGQIVDSAQTIGTVGDTGFTNGKAALQFGISVGDVFVDPAQLR